MLSTVAFLKVMNERLKFTFAYPEMIGVCEDTCAQFLSLDRQILYSY